MLTFLALHTLLAQLPPSPDNVTEFAGALLAAVMSGQWPIVAAMVLVAAVWGARKLAPRWAFFATDEGAFTLNLLTSFVLALSTALFAKAAITGALLLKALEMSFLAAGGWAALTKFLVPLLLRIPFLANMFARGSASTAIVEAERAGLAAAVVAKSPTSDEIANGP